MSLPDLRIFESRDKSQYAHPLRIHTAQRTWELKELVRVYRELHPAFVLEIGTDMGGTLWHWLNYAEPGTVVVNVDIHEGVDPRYHTELEVLWQSWCPSGVELKTLIGDVHSDEIREEIQRLLLYVDFLFIDADHTYEGSWKHWNRYRPMVRRGGIVAYHDLITPSFSPHIQVGKFWSELRLEGWTMRELYADPSEDWGGIGIVTI